MRSMREIHRSIRPAVNLKMTLAIDQSDKWNFPGKMPNQVSKVAARASSVAIQAHYSRNVCPPRFLLRRPRRRLQGDQGPSTYFIEYFFRIRRAHPTRRSSPNLVDGFLSLPTRPRPIAGEGNSRVGDRGRASTTREWFYRRESR